ncbi:Cadherin EGF LAG seven-pass G-type receptor 1 [Saguinus oedipus]|uniref:Cadherin EGF LAG seven-pass G-type receptor 1 n=1 Tax=Saguinus oedipus TaxID=9490 RepID=A0ABQ9WMA1_SAGOE|nr:Cadherin EGF LAG seven-pass G-type receptor 1 [Saguinus oedipus]
MAACSESPTRLPTFCHHMGTGEHCEVDARSGRCANGVCKNGGTCVNLLIGGFHCMCPPGEYERPYCEVTTRSFPPRSFVTFRGLRQRFHFTVSLTFATQERNGLLLYNGRFNEKHDFIALEVVDEQVQLTFSAAAADLGLCPGIPEGTRPPHCSRSRRGGSEKHPKAETSVQPHDGMSYSV